MTEKPHRVVLDTNVIVSMVIMPESAPARTVEHVIATSVLLISTSMILELEEVLHRPKLDRYSELETRLKFLWSLAEAAVPIFVISTVDECRDEKDNKLLALAFDGHADFIVTGDKDLLCLYPWRGIAVLSAVDYLAKFS